MLSRFLKRLFWPAFAIILLLAQTAAEPAHPLPETARQKAHRMRWWREARFGMFVHWGIYSVIGMEASWPLYGKQYARAEYEGQALRFHPSGFDARRLARLAKESGMKYLVITTKHHDGFCLWDTKLTGYSVMRGPLKRDLVREIVEACRQEGLRIGFYFSLCDWHDPRYRSLPVQNGAWPLEPIQPDRAVWNAYIDFMHGQIRELLTRYGKIDLLWFDGGWEHTPQEWRAGELAAMIRKLQPQIIMNDRLPGGLPDYATPEQFIPANPSPDPWETCMTINESWGYNPKAIQYKSASELIRNLTKTAGGNGNFLLNVGPRADGSVQPEFEARLKTVGAWLRRCGGGIYGSRGASQVFPAGGATVKGDTLYLYIPGDHPGPVALDRLATPVIGARMAASGRPVRVKKLKRGVRLHLDPKASDPAVTVVALKLAGPLKIDASVRPDVQGHFLLQASEAVLHGKMLAYQPQYDDLGYWVHPGDWCEWPIHIEQAGEYEIAVEYSVPEEEAGSVMAVETGKRRCQWIAQSTGPGFESWFTYRPVIAGRARLARGKTNIRLRCLSMAKRAVINLKSVRLRRIEGGNHTMSSRSVTAPAPLPPVPTPQQRAWQEMEYIAFAHFGVNTFTDREWGEGDEDPKLFNPSQFDARQWASVLKEAGVRMLILTAKHHDGFCLFPSRFTEHSVQSSPWREGRGDVVQEVADACREAGLKLGLYLSPWDRHEPTYGDSPAYNEYFKNQLGEILTRYGPITEVWFDGACGEGPNGKRQAYDWEGFYAAVRRWQPHAVIFGGPDIRWVGNEDGVARETEWSVQPPPEGSESPNARWFPAECDVSIRPGWFYHAAEDHRVKSLDHLMDIYFQSIGRNSVLLLNIPPDRRGLIHENDARRLIEFRRAVEALFKTDLALGAKSEASNVRGGSSAYGAGKALDGRADTYWAVDDGVTAAWLEVDLGTPAPFNVARIEEPVSLGQRAQAYRIEAWDGAAWKEISRGTTIGYRKLDRFPTLTARKARLVIEKSRACPLIRTFGLYLDPGR